MEGYIFEVGDTETEYDENGKALAEVDATGENKTKFGYVDGTSTVCEELSPNGSKFAYGRDYDDTVTAISQSTEEGEENSTQKVYLHGEVVELKSGNNSVKYAYDSKRRLNAVELNGVENYVQYVYTETLDSNGFVTKETVITTYESEDEFVSEKDGKGNLLKLTANNVVQIENVYNNKNQLDTLKDKVASKNYKFERDVLDNVTAIYEVNASGTKVSGGYDERITYDEFGSLKTRTLSGVVSQVYDYSYSDDSKRQVKSLVTPITSEEYEYDALNRKKKTSQVFAGHNFGKRYNYKKVSDHATNLIESIAYLKNGITDGKLSYTYDNMGNITSINENGKQIAKYTYDTLNRIIKENLLDKSKEIVYTYDNNGNILTKSVNGEIVEYKYKEDSDQLVSFGNETFEYDSIGNPTTFRNMTAVFENGRRLKSLSDGTNTVEYTYNGQGLRKSKKVGSVTTTYTYDGNGRLLKEVGEKTIEYVYGADGIIGIKISGTPYLFRKNMFGDVTHIYNQQGVIVGKYSYTAYGECTVELDTNGVASDNPIRYRSYYYDEETSLYYLKTRYYDPELGRFMTIDGISHINSKIINGLNLYAYCRNNPVMYIDSNGTDAILITAFGRYGLPLVGHSALYISIKNEKGNTEWYLVEFSGSNKTNARIYYSGTSGEIIVNPLQHAKQRYSGKNSGFSWYNGPFSSGYKTRELDIDFNISKKELGEIVTFLRKSYDGKYNLISNNCADFVQEFLSYGTNNAENLMIEYPAIIPHVYDFVIGLYETNTIVKSIVDTISTGWNNIKSFFEELFG